MEKGEEIITDLLKTYGGYSILNKKFGFQLSKIKPPN
jgi:hypothetical protein